MLESSVGLFDFRRRPTAQASRHGGPAGPMRTRVERPGTATKCGIEGSGIAEDDCQWQPDFMPAEGTTRRWV